MIEPSGTPVDVIGIPNRQSKVPGLGPNQPGGCKQSIMRGCSNSQAQDIAGYGAVGLAGLVGSYADVTKQIGDQTKAGQDPGSTTMSFGPHIAEAPMSYEGHKNFKDQRGVMGQEGLSQAPDMVLPDNVPGSGGDPLSNLSNNDSKSVDGNESPSGRVITSSNASTKDIGVQGSDASQGALIKTPGLAD
jgi:hypothetical protein